MIREDPLKNICRIPLSHLRKVERISGLASVKDFRVEGSKSENKHSWQRISQAVLVRDNYSCRVCGKSDVVSMDKDSFRVHMSVEVHHIIPRSSGGSSDFENLITLCEDCHHKTFGNGYSGIPVNRNPPLESFSGRRTVALPYWKKWPLTSDPASGKLVDFKRIDGEDGYGTVIESENSEIDALLYNLTLQEYSDLASSLELDYAVNDYCTMRFRSGAKMTQARVFLSESGIFI